MDPLDSKNAEGINGVGTGNATAAGDPNRALATDDIGGTGTVEEGVLASLGLSSENLSPVERERINQVVQYMHDQRSEDSLRMRELEERSNQLEAAFEDPRVKAALTNAMQPAVARPVESNDLLSAEELSLISTDPARFIKGLSAKIDNLVEKRFNEFKTSEIEPIKVKSRLQDEITSMDGMYSGWRKDAPIVRDTAKKDPTLTTVRQAYERGVLIPTQTAEIKRLQAQIAAFQRKTGVEGDSSLAAASTSGGQGAQKKVFNSEMEAILDAVERTNAMKRGA